MSLPSMVYMSTCGLMVSLVLPWLLVEPSHVDFVVEVSNVADDGLVLHGFEVRAVTMSLLPVAVTTMSAWRRRPASSSLQTLPWPLGVRRWGRFRHNHDIQRCGGSQILCPRLRSRRQRPPSGHHHIGGATNGVHTGLAAAILVVKLRLGHRIVHVDGRQGACRFFRAQRRNTPVVVSSGMPLMPLANSG